MTRTGFETEIDVSATDHFSLVRAKAVNGDGEELAWTDAADGNGNYLIAPDLDDSQVNLSDAPSSARGVAPSSTPTETMGSNTTPASPTRTGAASILIVPRCVGLEILAAGMALAGVLFF